MNDHTKTTANPLRKRYLRDLKEDFGKYAVIFILMGLTIAMVSGFIVCGHSMIISYQEAFTKYNTEDGNFVTEQELTEGKRTAIEGYGVRLIDNYYLDRNMTNGSVIRFLQTGKK